MRGRKRTPTELHVLRGNPGKHKLPEGEPEPSLGTAEPPDFLRPDAKAIWFRLAPEFMAQGILTASDSPALAIFCTAYADLQRAEIALEKEKDMEIIKTKSGRIKRENPWYYVKARAIQQCDKFAAQFGIGASYRAKLVVPGKGKKSKHQQWKDKYGK